MARDSDRRMEVLEEQLRVARVEQAIKQERWAREERQEHEEMARLDAVAAAESSQDLDETDDDDNATHDGLPGPPAHCTRNRRRGRRVGQRG